MLQPVADMQPGRDDRVCRLDRVMKPTASSSPSPSFTTHRSRDGLVDADAIPTSRSLNGSRDAAPGVNQRGARPMRPPRAAILDREDAAGPAGFLRHG
jgi:hypothetical protein